MGFGAVTVVYDSNAAVDVRTGCVARWCFCLSRRYDAGRAISGAGKLHVRHRGVRSTTITLAPVSTSIMTIIAANMNTVTVIITRSPL